MTGCMKLNASLKVKRFEVKGQFISKYPFGVFNSSKKTNLKFLISALAYWGRNLSFVFWKNWKKQKDISKLTDLYLLSWNTNANLNGMPWQRQFPPLTKNFKAGFKTRKTPENHFINQISLNNAGTYTDYDTKWHAAYSKM